MVLACRKLRQEDCHESQARTKTPLSQKTKISLEWWYMPLIPALARQRQVDI